MGTHLAVALTNSGIQDAFTAAQSDTDPTVVVEFPAGTGTLTAAITYTSHANTTNLTIKGAGKTNTILIDNFNSAATWMTFVFTANGMTAWIKDFQIQPHASTFVYKNDWIVLSGVTDRFAMSDVKIDAPSINVGNTFRMFGWLRGVFWDCEANYNALGGFFHPRFEGSGAGGEGDELWAAPTNRGGLDYLFVEDCSVIAGIECALEDAEHAAKWVSRFNYLRSVGHQTHPTAGQRSRGCRAHEIYCNDYDDPTSPPIFNWHFLSAGTCIAWNNPIPSGCKNVFTLHSMRRSNSTYAETAPPNGWGYAGTDSGLPGAGVNWDQNSDAATGYRALDQPGCGEGDLLSGAFPNVINVDNGNADYSSPNAWPRQALEPILVWDMPWTNPGWGGAYIAPADAGAFANDRDHYQDCNQITGAPITFDGTTGIGKGTTAQMNTFSSATEGVFFWVTDQGSWNAGTNAFYTGQGKLYRRTSGAWVEYYTPAAYPHPLRVELEGGSPSPPDPPIPPPTHHILMGTCLT